MRNCLPIVAALLALGLPVSPAQAVNTRSFVSATSGLDTNNCSRTAPCRTFAVAYAQTAVDGEINTLDPGGYGTLTITHSISIVSGVGAAGVLVPSGQDGITINAGASDIINLRGLVIEGSGVGTHGIAFSTGGSLIIENSVIRNFSTSGIKFAPQASSDLVVSDTFLSNGGAFGVEVAPTGAGAVTATFSRVEAHNCGNSGFAVYNNSATGGTIHATATESVAAGNQYGFFVQSTTGTAVGLNVVGSVAANNTIVGVVATGTNATMTIESSTVSDNAKSWYVTTGGVINSLQDNHILGNTSSNVGSLTPIGKQ
jgi:hypothetical protein